MAQRVDVVCRHSSMAMANAMEHQSLFLMPRVAGDRQEPLDRRRPHAAEDDQHRRGGRAAAGRAVPVARRLLGCKRRGRWSRSTAATCLPGSTASSTKVLVKHGDPVEKGQELVRLRNTEAEMALTQVEGERLVSQERIDSLQRTLAGRSAASPRRAGPAARRTGRGAGETGQFRRPVRALQAEGRGVDRPQPHPRPRRHLGPYNRLIQPAGAAGADAAARGRSRRAVAA